MTSTREHAGDDSPLGRVDPLATAVFFALVAVCLASFALIQVLKHQPTTVQNFRMDPFFAPTQSRRADCRGLLRRAQVNAVRPGIEYLSFRTAAATKVVVTVIDASGHAVAVLAPALRTQRYKQMSLCWTGRIGPHQEGELAPPGSYRLAVELLDSSRRRIDSPRSFYLRRS